MKKRIFRVLICFVVLFAAAVLTACGNEAEVLQARVAELESENAELHLTISSLSTDLERSQTNLSNAQNDLQNLLTRIEEEQASQDPQNGPLAITYGGEPNTDMTWPLSYGLLPLGLRFNPGEISEDDEIVWHSTDESIITVVPGEDGTTATVTPVTIGSAQLVVTVGGQETRSWVRIT